MTNTSEKENSSWAKVRRVGKCSNAEFRRRGGCWSSCCDCAKLGGRRSCRAAVAPMIGCPAEEAKVVVPPTLFLGRRELAIGAENVAEVGLDRLGLDALV